ncbi:MAG: aspartate kinase [Deltaproteobacteria bacterium]|nr:aspartate kinase [Deltaproteobacteria bacterium]
MPLVVQKYGGTSVASLDRIRSVAKQVVARHKEGNQVVVVVSAMAGETNRLIDLALSASSKPDMREYDALVATGEQVTSALLALILRSMGVEARSFLGHQVRIVTNNASSKARILRIEADRLRKILNRGWIAVVAGFQGVDEEGNITTLGRGGSDTTAVALASALRADRCEIFTDVEGVYTTDPGICPNARKLSKISYDEMLEMASLGAKVLQTRSVEFAKRYQIPVEVKSSLVNRPGTLVTVEDPSMENILVSGVTYDRNEAKVTILKVPDRPGVAAKIFAPLMDANISVDMIIQNVSTKGYTDLTFTVAKSDLSLALEIIQRLASQIGAKDVIADKGIAKVSIIGLGMRSHAGVASKMFQSLARAGINIQMISTSEIKISCVIDEKYTELAVRVLHDAFELGNLPRPRSKTGKKKSR